MDTKLCGECRLDLPISAFNAKRASKDGLQNKCRGCEKKRYDRYYADNRKRQINSVNARVAKHRARVDAFLSENPCVDCGFSDIRALDFDHVRGNKIAGVKKMLGGTWQSIEEEIAKCEVRCANCHRIVTHERLKLKKC